MSGGAFVPSSGAPGGGEKDDWYVECSDDEKYTSSGRAKGHLDPWYPPPQEMIGLLEAMEAAARASSDPMKPVIAPGLTNLDWKCPGRRPPTPSDSSGDEDSDAEQEPAGSGKVGGPSGTGPAGSAAAAASSMDFEFDTNDEIAPSGTPLAKLNKDNKELRGSARKKTSDLNSILSNMQRHKIADRMATGAPVAKPPSHS